MALLLKLKICNHIVMREKKNFKLTNIKFLINDSKLKFSIISHFPNVSISNKRNYHINNTLYENNNNLFNNFANNEKIEIEFVLHYII